MSTERPYANAATFPTHEIESDVAYSLDTIREKIVSAREWVNTPVFPRSALADTETAERELKRVIAFLRELEARRKEGKAA